MSYLKSIITIYLFTATAAFAQMNTFNAQFLYKTNLWASNFNNLKQTYDKGYVFCRGTIDTINGIGEKYCELVKINREGGVMWTKRLLNGTQPTHATFNTVAQNNQNGIILATSEYQTDSAHVVLLCTDSIGNTLWAKKYPGECKSFVFKVIPATDNGYVISGSTIDSNNVEYAYLFKTNSVGDYIWGKKIILPGDTMAGFYSCVEIPGEGYLATGYSGAKALAVKFDYAGNIIWDKKMFTYAARFLNVARFPDGSFILSGSYADSIQNYMPKLFLVKFNALGNILWEKGLQENAGPYSGSYIWDLKTFNSNEFVFSGYISNPIPTLLVGKLNVNGNIIWTKEYRSTFHTFNYEPCSIETTLDGGMAVNLLGGTFTNGVPTFSSELLKLDGNGFVGCDGLNYSLQLKNLNYPTSSGILSYTCGTEASFVPTISNVVINDTTLCKSILDFHILGLTEYENQEYNLFQNYPNPSNGITTIDFYLGKTINQISLEIYDSKGSLILIKKLGEQFEGKHSIDMDLKLTSGVYFYSLINDGSRKTKCMQIE